MRPAGIPGAAKARRGPAIGLEHGHVSSRPGRLRQSPARAMALPQCYVAALGLPSLSED